MKRAECFAAALMLAIFSVAGAHAANITRLTTGPRSTLVLDGSSNVAKWRCTGTTMSAEANVDASIRKINEVIDRIEDGNIGVWMSSPASGQFPPPRFALSIPIDSLRCSGGSPMERDMSHALKAARYPSIDFRFDNLSAGIEHDLDQRLYRTSIRGHLALGGVTRELTVPLIAERLSPTRFRLRAELPVRMTDFAIAPPKALFGLIKADDRLVVRFDLILEVVP